MKFYFMGIGGVAMGNAALLARQMGHTVLGSDGPLYPPMSTALAGLQIFEGYSAERLSQLINDNQVDAVIIGNSVGRGHVEVEWFWQHKPCAFYSLPEFLKEFVLKNRPVIAACGTHGKTTTTTLTAYLLEKNNAHPGWLIGGVPQDLTSGANIGGDNSSSKNSLLLNNEGFQPSPRSLHGSSDDDWVNSRTRETSAPDAPRSGGLPKGVQPPLEEKENKSINKISNPFVIEGDEYDSAFFDKRAKFISYQPTIAILNNLEPDHLDIYRDIDDLKRTFNHLLRTIPGNGLIIANADDPNLRSILPVSWVPVLWVSAQNDPIADLHILNFKENPSGSSFDLCFKGNFWSKISWSLPGLFNARNAAMAALAAGWALSPKIPTALNLDVLKDFIGVKRRQELRFSSPTLTVIEDFAHHPTAVDVTLRSLRARFPAHRIIACLEPRSGTTRTNAHQEAFVPALALADEVILAPVHNGDKMSPSTRLDTARLATDIIALGRTAHATTSCNDIPNILQKIIDEKIKENSFSEPKNKTSPCLIVFFSNGTFQGAMDHFLNSLSTVTVS